MNPRHKQSVFITKMVFAAAIVSTVVSVSAAVAAIWVTAHFIAKFW